MRFWISVCLTMCVSALAAANVSAATIAVPAGGDLQAAIDAARPGDVITLAPNATYTGNFVLPNKGAIADYITIRSAAPDALLPAAGVRMTPSYKSQLPKLRSPNGFPALRTTAAANHWRLMFLEFLANKDGLGEILAFGAGDSTQTQLSQVPYALIVDRIYMHGDPVVGQKRGIALHSGDTSVVNSWVSECKAIGQDSQAISGYNGPGNYLIENNYLEGAGENFLLGGGDPTIPGLVTTNVTVRRNYLRKPIAWRDSIMPTPANVTASAAAGGSLPAGTYYYKVQARGLSGQTKTATSAASAQVSATIDADTTGAITISWTPVSGATEYLVYGRTSNGQNMYWQTTNPYMTDNGSAGTSGTPAAGTKWSVKNNFELKIGQDVLVEGNVLEGMWMADQPGYPIVLTPRNQNGGAPWTVVQRVTVQHNLVRHTAGGVNILGTDNLAPSQQTNHIVVRNNIFDDLSASSWGSGSRPFQLGGGADSITIDHNTVMSTQLTVFWLYGAPSTAVTFTNNMSAHNSYGIFGSGQSSGNLSIATYLPDGVVRGNVLAGGIASRYPAGNFFPTVAAWQADFVDYSAGDYHLIASSVYKRAGTDGEDLGANVDVVLAQTANALTGDNRGTPSTTRVQITTTSLANGVVGQAYAASLSCTGATGACGWRVQSSTLPAGINVDTVAGLIYGTPTAVETGAVTLEAYDTANPSNSAVAKLTLTIDAAPFVMTMPAPPVGQVGVAYQLSPSVSGTVGSASWTVASGTLPGGLVLDGFSGAISGVPTTWGTTTAVIQVTDSWGVNRSAATTLTVTIAPLPLAVTTTSLPAGSVQGAYQATLEAIGGTGLTTWTIASGSLPNGLTLANTGIISGTPVSVGSSTFTARASDAGWAGNVATQQLTINVTANVIAREIVLYASDASRLSGTWSLANDAAAAGGVRIWNQDRGAAKLTTPLANPVNFFEITFEAQAGVGYHLWMRGKADNNAWANDSVYVQYSGSVDANGAATARIGSTSARTFSIEQGTNAGLQGWGWSDDAWDGLGAPIYFAASGTQTLRVQVREDGLSLDQIVLSSATYFTAQPGAAKNDTTILPR